MIAIASDRLGYPLKCVLAEHLKSRGLECQDFGSWDATTPVNYPVYGFRAAQAVKNGDCDRAILVCGTGLGMQLVANKVRGIRAVSANNEFLARMSREHNDANVLTLGAYIVGDELAKAIVDAWLDARYDPWHQVRVDMLTEVEQTGDLQASRQTP